MATHGGYKLYREGDNVRDLLDKIEDLDNVDVETFTDGTMPWQSKKRLDEIGTLTYDDIDDICV